MCTCTGGYTGADCSIPPQTCTDAGDNAGDVMIVSVLHDAQTEPDGEYILLYNNSCGDIDLAGWQICDNGNCLTFNTKTLGQGKGLALVASSGASGLGVYGCSADDAHLSASTAFVGGSWFGGLGNSGDEVELKNAVGVHIDAMSYGSNSTFSPSLPDRSENYANQRTGYPWSGTLPANSDSSVWEISPLNGHICDLSATGVYQ